MSHSSNFGNKYNQLETNSALLSDDNIHSINNAIALSLQSFVDDIPFEFNPKYRTIIVPNTNIPDYDTTKIRNILTKPVDFTLENKVLLEALEDLKRKKKELEEDKLHQQSSTFSTNCPVTNSVSISSNNLPENIPFPATFVPMPPLASLPSSHPTIHLPTTVNTFPVSSVPPALSFPQPSLPLSLATKAETSSISTSYHLPSVRDIYWPTGNQQQYFVPANSPSTLTTNTLNLPIPIRSATSSPTLVKSNNQSFNNCDSAVANDLAATFDGGLGSDDPFHEAELKSLNDVAELRHLYSAIGSANTVRR